MISNLFQFILVWVSFFISICLDKTDYCPIIIHMLQNGFVVIFQLLNPEALKKATEQANLYITFLFHNKKNESHTDYSRCDSFLFFFLFRFTK